jgi:hypothetical protein
MVFFVLLFVFIVLLFVFLMLLMMFLVLLMIFLMLLMMFLMLLMVFLMLLMMFLMLLVMFPMLLRMFLMMFLVISMMMSVMAIMVTPVTDVPIDDDSLVNDGRSTHHPLHVCVGGGSRGLEKGGKLYSAGIFKTSMRARNRVGIGLLYRPARLYSLAELVPWNRFVDLHVENLGLCTFTWHVNKRIDCQRLARLLCPVDQNIG